MTQTRFRLLLVLGLGLVHCAESAEDAGDLIRLEQAGTVKIGDEAQHVYEQFPKSQRKLIDLELEGSLTPALSISLPNSTVERSIIAELSPRDDRLVVWRIKVLDPALRTTEAIGVGSTMGELRASYKVTWIGTGEGGVYAYVESLSASFELDPTWYWQISRESDPDKIPAEVKIASILLTSR